MIDVAILNALDPATSSVDWGDSPVQTYIRFFQSVDAPFAYTGYDVREGQFPTSPAAHDAYVITGSPSGAYESDPWIRQLAQFIQDCYAQKKKLVGICFGHQMLAQALGGAVTKSEKGWGLGKKAFTVTERKPWMTPTAVDNALYFVHQDQVQQLPPGAELLGGSDFCPIGLFTIGDQVLGVQAHPEFTPRIMDELLYGRLRDQIPTDVWNTAVASLADGRPDNARFARWLTNFIRL